MSTTTAPVWLGTFRTYLLRVTLLHAGWEVLQLPLYTLWSTASVSEIAFAVVHCTAGDALIAGASLVVALLLAGSADWPCERFKAVALWAIAVGVVYTVYSEWHNTTVTRSWAYAAAMPSLFGIGLSPLAQWVLVPGVVFWRIQRRLTALA